VVQRAYNSVGIFGLVAAGMGITLHSETARNTLHPDLVIRPVTDFRPRIPTIAAWLRNNEAPVIRAFTAFLREQNHVKCLDTD
jgi:DNA-binding transcriptional LysR family regulator